MFTTRATVVLATSLAAGLVASCGGAGANIRPDDMSVAEHLRTADQLEQQAKAHEQQYDPDAEATRPSRVYANQEETYNPTEEHLQQAEHLRELADEHREAAEDLRELEDDQCEAVPEHTRAECPLVGKVSSVDDIPGGARIHFTDGVDIESARELVQCHLAYAQTQGREGMDQCPMFVDGARAETDGAAGTVDLVTGGGAQQVAELRQRARTHLPE